MTTGSLGTPAAAAAAAARESPSWETAGPLPAGPGARPRGRAPRPSALAALPAPGRRRACCLRCCRATAAAACGGRRASPLVRALSRGFPAACRPALRWGGPWPGGASGRCRPQCYEAAAAGRCGGYSTGGGGGGEAGLAAAAAQQRGGLLARPVARRRALLRAASGARRVLLRAPAHGCGGAGCRCPSGRAGACMAWCGWAVCVISAQCVVSYVRWLGWGTRLNGHGGCHSSAFGCIKSNKWNADMDMPVKCCVLPMGLMPCSTHMRVGMCTQNTCRQHPPTGHGTPTQSRTSAHLACGCAAPSAPPSATLVTCPARSGGEGARP